MAQTKPKENGRGKLYASEPLVDAFIQHHVRIQGLTAAEVRKFGPFLKAIDADIRKRLSGDELTDYSRRRLLRQLTALDGSLADVFSEYKAVLTKDLKALADHEASFTAGTMEAHIEGVEFDVPSASQIRAAIKSRPLSIRGPDGGKVLDALVDDWTQAERNTVINAIKRGVVEGQSNSEIVKAVRGTRSAGYKDGLLAVTDRHARAIAHTAIEHVSTVARQETFAANEDIVKGVRWIATLDMHACATCRSLDQIVFALDKGPRPPAHINCLPGDSLVLARSGVNAASKRWYEGELVRITTASNRVLTCTPNHPILTTAGWVAAKDVDKVGNVICDGGREWVGGSIHHDDDGISSIHDVVESFRRRSGVMAAEVPVTAPNFHGDGANSDVAVIWTDSELRSAWMPALPEHGDETAFGGRCVSNAALPGFGPFDALGHGPLAPAKAGVIVGKKLAPFLRRAFRPLRALGIRLAARLDAVANKISVNCRPAYASACTDGVYAFAGQESRDASGQLAINNLAFADGVISGDSFNDFVRDAKLARYILDGSTGPVFVDDIASVSVEFFSGHIFNLETGAGFYSANGIITHNCRCTTVPVLLDEFDKYLKGATRPAVADGQASQIAASVSYYTWLKRQSAAFQDEVLGPTRGKLFRDGGLSAKRFSELMLDRNFQPLTLEEMKALEPAAFRKAGI